MKKKFLSGMMALCMMLAMVLSVIATPLTAKAEDPIDWSNWKWDNNSEFMVTEKHSERDTEGSSVGALWPSRIAMGTEPVFGLMDMNNNFSPLEAGVDYEITRVSKWVVPTNIECEFDKNVPADYTFTLTGKGKYCGTTDVDVTVYNPSGFWEIGVEVKKDVLFKGELPVFVRGDNGEVLVDGTDYTITYVMKDSETLTEWDFTEPGKYYVEVTGKGNYSDNTTVSFTVFSSETDLNYLKAGVKESNIPQGTNPVIGYQDGDSFKVLEEGKDYTIGTFDNNELGEHNLTVTGQGTYEGSITVTFWVEKANNLMFCNAGLETVNGEKVVVVKTKDGATLTKDTDYTLEITLENEQYEGNTYTEHGFFFFIVRGINDYTGEKSFEVMNHTYEWTVKEKATSSDQGEKCKECTICGDIDDETYTSIPQIGKVALSTTKYTYSGTKKAPTVTVEDVNGNKIDSSNYTVSNPKVNAVGTHKVTVTFKNEYDGEKTLTYTINPKAVSIKSLKATKKGFTVTWPKSVAANATGYEIKYSLKSSMASAKTVKVTSYKTASKTIQKLQAKKKYYVQMRVYKKVGSKTFYSAWSAKKSVTTKK